MGGNRKERRAAAAGMGKNNPAPTSTHATTASAFQPSTEIDQDGIEYILQHPDRSGPKGKTLFELAEERQRELDKGKPARRTTTNDDNTPIGERPFDDEPLGPLSEGIIYSLTMAISHITFDVLVYSQYREDVIWSEIFKRAASALPIFFLLVYLMHVPFSNRFPLARNLLFFGGGIAAGCYLVYAGNRHGYFYVMKAAPPIATLWIWSVVEMDVAYSALSAVAVLAYSWWNNFDFF